MSLQDILAIEQTNTHHIYFYREGVFYKAYERLAYCRLLSTIACGILLTVFTGCGNNQSTSFGDDLASVGDPVEINILTTGIESFADAEEVATRAGLAGSTAAEQIEQTVQTIHTQVQPLNGGGSLVATVKASKATRVAAASPTHTRAITLKNTTLRVLAYNNDGQYVDDCLYNVDGSGIATARSGQRLVVPARTTPYTFYCYSPGVCESNTETKEVSVDAADAFAFGTQKVTVDGSSPTQTVRFSTLAQKRASIKLSVTSTDAAMAVDSYTAVLSRGTFANSATFSLTAGAYSSFGTASVRSLPFDASVAEHFILPSANTGEMTLTLSNLVVVGGKALSSPPIKIPAITLAAGTRYILDIKVRPISPKDPFIILPSIGLRVAKGNLMRANGTGPWFSAPDQGYYTDTAAGGDYFCWGIADPTKIGDGTASNAAALTAGCVAVLGAGWRVPSKADNVKLANGANNVWGTYRSQRGMSSGMYFGTSIVPVATANQDDYVFLPAAGYRLSSGGMDDVGSNGYYWSSEPDGGSRTYGITFGSSFIHGANNLSRNLGLSVRCVADY